MFLYVFLLFISETLFKHKITIMAKKNVGIFLYDDVEVLDFAGAFEVFTATNELNNNELFKTFIISPFGQTVITRNNLKILPDYGCSHYPDIDILVIPGGDGSKAASRHRVIKNWFKHAYENTEMALSICTGIRFFAEQNFLDGMKVTTHHSAFEEIRKTAPKAEVLENERFTDNGKLLTAAGVSAAIDLSLYVVEKLEGKTIAQKTRAYMEYGDWKN